MGQIGCCVGPFLEARMPLITRVFSLKPVQYWEASNIEACERLYSGTTGRWTRSRTLKPLSRCPFSSSGAGSVPIRASQIAPQPTFAAELSSGWQRYSNDFLGGVHHPGWCARLYHAEHRYGCQRPPPAHRQPLVASHNRDQHIRHQHTYKTMTY